MEKIKLIVLRIISLIGISYGFYCLYIFSDLNFVSRHNFNSDALSTSLTLLKKLDFFATPLVPALFIVILGATFYKKTRISAFFASALGFFIEIFNISFSFLFKIPNLKAYYAINPGKEIQFIYNNVFENFEQNVVSYKISLMIFLILFFTSAILSKKS